MKATDQIYVEPSAVLVDLPEEVLELCHVMLPSSGLAVHSVTYSPATCDQIASLLPELVIVPVTMRAAELDMIEDRAVAVGATILYLDAGHGHESVETQIFETLKDVNAKFAGRRRFGK